MPFLWHYYVVVEPLECGPGGTDPNDPCPPPANNPGPGHTGPTTTPGPGTSTNPGSQDPSPTTSHNTSPNPSDTNGTDNVAPGQHTTVPDEPMLPLTGPDPTVAVLTGILIIAAGIVAIVVTRSRFRRP